MAKDYKRSRNCFVPGSDKHFKLSRSKIELFIECPRCFYVDRRLGISRPPSIPFNLNIAVDHLLKKEFDLYRENRDPHPIMVEYDINAIPFQHDNLEKWRENFVGIQYLHEPTGFLITGAIDDVWEDVESKQLIVVDYKATSKANQIVLDSPWYQSYKRQLDIYQWLLRRNGFDVSNDGYFLFCNANKNRLSFDNRLEFDTVLIAYVGNDDWIDEKLFEIHRVLSDKKTPKPSPECKYCSYLEAVNNARHGSELF